MQVLHCSCHKEYKPQLRAAWPGQPQGKQVAVLSLLCTILHNMADWEDSRNRKALTSNSHLSAINRAMRRSAPPGEAEGEGELLSQ